MVEQQLDVEKQQKKKETTTESDTENSLEKVKKKITRKERKVSSFRLRQLIKLRFFC